MATDRFIIAPLESGQQTNVRPWLITDNAFSSMSNAYAFRGRVRKRFGSYVMNRFVDPSVAQQYTRFRMSLGSTDISGAATVTVPGSPVTQIGGAFSIGNEMLTIQALGATVTLKTTGATVAVLNTTISTNNLVITGSTASTVIYYYPGLPVMGLPSEDTTTPNVDMTIGFDQMFAYQFTGGAWERLATEASAGASVWSGSDTQFFWTTNYRIVQLSPSFVVNNTFFVTNNNPPDLMRYLDPANVWHFFNPALDSAGSTLTTALILVPFKGVMVALNTYEHNGPAASDARYPNRARWCQFGSPLETNAWQTDITGKGGFLDCPISQEITGAAFIKDRLIVQFQESTWELVYNNNYVEPFSWYLLNDEFGSDSPFSSVPFDQVILTVGNVGITSCNGLNVNRIDDKIPQSVFNIHQSNNGPNRVYGIRDYTTEMVYWTFPNFQFPDDTFPSKILVYNYQNGSWAFNDDSFTCFGYFQDSTTQTWATENRAWQDINERWVSPTEQMDFRKIIAGNQQGFTFIVDPGTSINAQVLSIINIVPGFPTTFTVVNHNLHEQDFIQFANAQGTGNLIPVLNGNIWQVAQIIDTNTFTIQTPNPTVGTYTGGGTIARVSRIDMYTKEYNFYLNQARNFSISKVDFQVDRVDIGPLGTERGQIALDYFTSTSVYSLVNQGIETGAIVGNAILDTSPYETIPYEASQTRLWHTVYTQADGEFIQLRIFLNDTQMMDPFITSNDFQLHSFIFYATPTASRLQ